ncbi:MAG: YfhO family protein [Thermomicrobiales bacterium]
MTPGPFVHPDEDSVRESSWFERHSVDIFAVSVLALFTFIVCWHRFTYDNWLSRHDLLAFFIPWYGYLGDRLSAFELPLWNPHLFSGSPFAGDPESGWMYLPAMLAFSIASVTTGMKLYILIQLVVAGLSTYILSRVLGLGAMAAMLAATLLEFGPFLYTQTDCCTVGAQTNTWIPLGWLGVELAFRARDWRYRLASIFLAGIAVSQLCAAWLGQGMYNALMIVGAWVVYRGLFVGPGEDLPWLRRIVETGIVGLGAFGTGFALAAAGLLPRLAFNAASINPGGTYEGLTGAVDSPFVPFSYIVEILFNDSYARQGSNIGGVAAILGLFAVLLVGRRYGASYFAGVTAIIFLLAMGVQPFLWLFDLLPLFHGMHIHSPGRITWLMAPGIAMLAGIGFQGVLDRRGRYLLIPVAILPLGVVGAAGAWMSSRGVWIGWSPYLAAVITTAVIVVAMALPVRGAWEGITYTRIMQMLSCVVVVMAFWFPAGRNIVDAQFNLQPDPTAQLMWSSNPVTQDAIARNLARTEPGTGAAFLQQQQATQPPFRYVGYGGRYYENEGDFTYPDRRLWPPIMAIMTNGRPFRLGLEQTQGYNPLQLKAYADYVLAMNGKAQNYHYLDLLWNGAQSPLLDMLNVRYIVVDATLPADRADVVVMAKDRKEVYRDAEVVIYENPRAYSRAWIVHDVRPNDDGVGLAQLATGEIDGHTVAFVDGTVPAVSPLPAGSAADSATVTSFAPESITVQATLNAPGLLVLSEVYDKGWHAFVDGAQVDVLQTNGALRGVALPAGEHTVVFRYEPREVTIGLLVTGVATAAMLAAFALAGLHAIRRRRGDVDDAAYPAFLRRWTGRLERGS